MIALKLVQLIELHSEELAHSLIRKIENSEKCADLKKISPLELEIRAFEVYKHLSEWLTYKTEHDIEHAYRQLGKQRCHQGVALNNLFWGMILTKENLWDFIEREFVEESGFELRGELELLRLLDQFFDRALYYLFVGYWQAQHEVTPRRQQAYA
jgi:hypothetical protein